MQHSSWGRSFSHKAGTQSKIISLVLYSRCFSDCLSWLWGRHNAVNYSKHKTSKCGLCGSGTLPQPSLTRRGLQVHGDGEKVTCGASCITTFQGEPHAFVKLILEKRMPSHARTAQNCCSQIHLEDKAVTKLFLASPTSWWWNGWNQAVSDWRTSSIFIAGWDTTSFEAEDFQHLVNFQFRFLTSSHWNLVIFGMLKNLHFHFLMISIKLFLLVIAIALFSKHWLWRIYMYLNIILLSSSLPLTPHLERIILQVKWQSLDSYKTTWTQDCQ